MSQVHPPTGAFLPLTLAEIADTAADRPVGERAEASAPRPVGERAEVSPLSAGEPSEEDVMSQVHPPTGAFLPLTLAEIADTAADRPALVGLADRAWAAERAAEDSWHALLGDCACARRGQLADQLRLLSEAAGEYAGGDWWSGPGSSHRDRVAEFEHWVTEALDEGDGEEFAEACAGYDAALAHAMATLRGRAARA